METAADNVSPERTAVVTGESTARPSIEVISLSSSETSAAKTAEATVSSSAETRSATTEAATTEPTTVALEEGASYKGVLWGADFNAFKAIKGFAGSLAPLSAAFVGTADDNDIAMLLGVPVSGKDANGEQRVMFECVPRKFASVYHEPDDTYYIFYNGKFAMTFSNIDGKNFDLYRDTFYKKYKKSGSFTSKYELGQKKSRLLQSSIFEKGKTSAFLVKDQLNVGKKSFVSTKLVFASSELLVAVRKEIEDKLAAEKLSGGEKDKQQLEKDLNKIE
ncbi:MAG: hypothetical protein PHG97_03005 [Candidatus Margulisbacteria bacterium]|nr:hypothetical protein [Candidatus Margulisiibacteriota bacterium]